MGLDLGGVGGGNGYDQTTVYEVCKELIKISFKEGYLPSTNLLSQ